MPEIGAIYSRSIFFKCFLEVDVWNIFESACVKLDLLDTVGYVLIHLAALGRGGLRRWTLGKSRDFQVYSSWLLATPALEASSSWASWRRMPVLLRFSATPQRCSLRSIIILSLRTLLPPRFLRTLVPPPWFLRTLLQQASPATRPWTSL